jgi:hypothetical protein
MKRFDYPALNSASRQSLSKAPQSPRHTVLLHSGATLLLALVLSLIAFLLDRQIGESGGLGGTDRRILLTTVQTVLRFLYIALLPFWSIGYTFYSLQLSQQEPARNDSLWAGFRLFNPVLRLNFLSCILIGGVLFFGYQTGYFLFCTTPQALPLLKVAAQMAETSDPNALLALEPAFTAALNEVLLPLLCFVVPVCLLFAAPIFYRFRLAGLYLMEYPEEGALRALLCSANLMRGNYLAMIRLDLYYWWYHGLRLLFLLIGCSGFIVPLTGISLPLPADVLQLLCTTVYVLGSLAIAWWHKPGVNLAYTHAYLILQDPPREECGSVPIRQPWNY